MSVIGKIHCGGCHQIVNFNEAVTIGEFIQLPTIDVFI